MIFSRLFLSADSNCGKHSSILMTLMVFTFKTFPGKNNDKSISDYSVRGFTTKQIPGTRCHRIQDPSIPSTVAFPSPSPSHLVFFCVLLSQ
ncbi:Protein Greb1 [Manis pentadactyla]|nr:Protein Greb1 [Manis pentadactyla]